MPFIIKCNGGPAAGVRLCDDLEEWGLSWPLPDVLPDPGPGLGGSYVKVSESQLPIELAEHKNVGLGAQYDWQADK